MQSKKIILSVLIICALCVGIVSVCHVDTAQAAASDYYDAITAQEGKELLGQLHDLITTTHTKYTKYDDCKNSTYVGATDKAPGQNKIYDFYSHAIIDAAWASGETWSREHVWCQSLSAGLWSKTTASTRGGGSDLHHIRPTWNKFNNSRGNFKYGVVTYKNEKYMTINNTKYLGGYADTGGPFEPIDAVKGDVARILFYVYTHYNAYSNEIFGGYATTNGTTQSYFGTLNFTNIVARGSEQSAISLLLYWNQIDPVDSIERNRNEEVYKIQGNRNPFIDHPEYATAIWGEPDPSESEPVVPPQPQEPEKPFESDRFAVDKTFAVIHNGETVKLQAAEFGEDNFQWTSDDEQVATVQDGIVTAHAKGTTKINVSNGSEKLSVTVVVVGTWNTAEFINAVNDIDFCVEMQEKFVAINTAKAVYSHLSAQDKQAVAEQYRQLQEAIGQYNDTATQENKTHTGGVSGAAIGMASNLGALGIIVFIVKRKLL